jgi:hypothetical protein
VGLVLAIHATAPGGLPDMDPVGGPVAGAAEASHIHQGFQQKGAMPESRFPRLWHLPGAECQNLAGQSWDAYPWQDQKPAIVDDGLQVALPLFVTPRRV